jgi:WD40 repeat protein
MGTSTRIIKIISLKGYEFEIYEAHQAGIRLLTFIPNEGIMISVDDDNEVAVWNLKDLSADPIRVKVPQPGTSGCLIVTQLYAPTFLSSEAENHKNVFFALSSGDVIVFDWTNATFSSVVISYSLMFHRQKKDNVSDIKAHPLKMHRLLIAYE